MSEVEKTREAGGEPDAVKLFLYRVEPALRRVLGRSAPSIDRVDVLQEALFGVTVEGGDGIRTALQNRRRQRRLAAIVDLALREMLADVAVARTTRSELRQWVTTAIDRLPHRTGNRLRSRFGLDLVTDDVSELLRAAMHGSHRPNFEALRLFARAILAELIVLDEASRKPLRD